MPWGALGKNVFAECRAQEALGKVKKNKNKFCRVPGPVGTRQRKSKKNAHGLNGPTGPPSPLPPNPIFSRPCPRPPHAPRRRHIAAHRRRRRRAFPYCWFMLQITLSLQLYVNGDLQDLDSQWNLRLVMVSTFLLSVMRM